METWKDIKGYEGMYRISNQGRVFAAARYRNDRGFTSPRIMKQSKNKGGYHYVILSKNDNQKLSYVHRLVATAFIPNPQNKSEVNHIDGNPSNNHVSNLEWCTRKENVEHSWNVLHHNDVKSVHQYSLGGEYIASYRNAKIASETIGIATSEIYSCCNNKKKSADSYMWSYHKVNKREPYIHAWLKPCIVFDKFGNILGKYESIREASELYNVNEGQASHCCNGDRNMNMCGDYVFKFLNDDDTEILISQINTQIKRTTVHGVLIKKYNNCIEASCDTNIPFVYILRNCNKKTKTCLGSIYSFEIV